MQGMALRSPFLCMLLTPIVRSVHRESSQVATFSTSIILRKRLKPPHCKPRAPDEPSVTTQSWTRQVDSGKTAASTKKSDDDLYTDPDSKYVKLTRTLIKTTAEREQALWGHALGRLDDLAEAESRLYANTRMVAPQLSCTRATRAGYVRDGAVDLSSILETTHGEIEGAVEELRAVVPAMLAEPLPSEHVIWRREGVDVSKVDLKELERDIAVFTAKREMYLTNQSAAVDALEDASRQYKSDHDKAALMQNVVRAVDSFTKSSDFQDGRQIAEEGMKEVLKARQSPDVDPDVSRAN